jgi:hypothetical protein
MASVPGQVEAWSCAEPSSTSLASTNCFASSRLVALPSNMSAPITVVCRVRGISSQGVGGPGCRTTLSVMPGIASRAVATAISPGSADRGVQPPPGSRARSPTCRGAASTQRSNPLDGQALRGPRRLRAPGSSTVTRSGVATAARRRRRPRSHQLSRSTIIAIPWPPATHIVSRPIVASSVSSPLSSVVMIRAPVMPNGCPRAIAPPWGLSLS